MVILGAILIAVIGLLTGLVGGVASLMAATCAALAWGLVGGWVAHLPPGQAALRLVTLVVLLHAAFLVGLALRTLARR